MAPTSICCDMQADDALMVGKPPDLSPAALTDLVGGMHWRPRHDRDPVTMMAQAAQNSTLLDTSPGAEGCIASHSVDNLVAFLSAKDIRIITALKQALVYPQHAEG